MTSANRPASEKRKALTVRLPPAILDRLKEEAAHRRISQAALIEMLIADQKEDIARVGIDAQTADAAAAACIDALDLLIRFEMAPKEMASAASKLEDFLDLLSTPNRP